MTIAFTGNLDTDAKVQYICTLVRGKPLRKFDLFSYDVENAYISLTVDYLLKGLAWYFFPVNLLTKQKRAMYRCMKKTRSLKVRRYSARLIDLN